MPNTFKGLPALSLRRLRLANKHKRLIRGKSGRAAAAASEDCLENPLRTHHERFVNAALMVLAGFLPVWIVLAHRGVAPTLLAMGLVAATRGEIWRAGFPYFLSKPDRAAPLARAGLFFAAFCLWVSLSGLWAPRPDAPRLALDILLPVLAGGAVIWEISRRPPERAAGLARFLAYVGAAAIALVVFEAATGGFLRTITPPADITPGRTRDMIALGRGATIIMVTLFAALWLFYLHVPRKPLIAMLAIGAVFAALKFDITSNVAGIVLGAAVLWLALKAPQRMLTIVGWAIIAALMLAPFAALIPVEQAIDGLSGRLPVSWLQRLAIWENAGRLAFDCLPFGCGADYSRAVHALGVKVVIPGAPDPLSVMPVHPHNMFLQIWLEFGLPGVALIAASLFYAMRAAKAASLSRVEIAVLAATAASFLVSALVEASLWQLWRLSAPLIAGAFIAAARQKRLGGAAP
jgi:O-antigen ligase